MAYLKKLVSKKKRRYYDDGYDLDLSYIKPNIVAMGFPSDKIEGVYRNHIDEILRFVEDKHNDHYKIYNLCSERQYDPSKFANKVANFPFDDHNAPPFQLIEPYCVDMLEFLGADDKNVAFVHCKAGKGRTGVMICAYLLHKNFFKSCKEALEYYGDARTMNKKGVTIPSQRRYVYYYNHYLKHKLTYTPTTLLITKFEMETVPSVNNGTCSPFFYIWQSKVKTYSSKAQESPKKGDKTILLELPQPLPVCGDIKIQFYNKDRSFKKDLMFQFWFNTLFVSGLTPRSTEGESTMDTRSVEGKDELGTTSYFELQKEDLDKANKDKKNKIFSPNFKLRVYFTVPDLRLPVDNYDDGSDKETNGHTITTTTFPDTLKTPGTPTETFTHRKSPQRSPRSPRPSGCCDAATLLSLPTSSPPRKTKDGISHSASNVSLDNCLQVPNLSDSDEDQEWEDKIITV